MTHLHHCYRIVTLFSVILLLGRVIPAKGQNYFCDFENSSKGNYALDTININGYNWALNETVITTHASDIKNGQRAVRFRNSTGNNTFMVMAEDKHNGLGSVHFKYARANFSGDRTGEAPQLIVDYSTDEGQNWINIDTVNFTGIDTLTQYQSDTLNITGRVRVRFSVIGNGIGKRINIDDLLITPFVVLTHITLLQKSPEGLDISPETDSLVLNFDHDIIQGNGSIEIYRSGNDLAQTITVPSANIVTRDSTAVIRDIWLEHNTSYYVLLTEGCFTNANGLLPNLVIEDTIEWTFTIKDTSSPVPFTELNEIFAACYDTVNTLGMFFQYSSAGNRVWQCDSEGRNDSAAICMLGGIAAGVSETNRDWLISRAPFDLSAMSTPVLSLWQKKRYEGNIERDIRISTDYKGSGNPEEATWHILEVQAMTSSPAFYWTPITDILLDSLKYTPFYLAFTYSCLTDGAFALLYDDISISNESLTIPQATKPSFEAKIAGQCSPSCFRLQITADDAIPLSLEVININGQKCYNRNIYTHKGTHIYVMRDMELSKGMYLIRLRYNGSQQILKALLL